MLPHGILDFVEKTLGYLSSPLPKSPDFGKKHHPFIQQRKGKCGHYNKRKIITQTGEKLVIFYPTL